MSIFLNESPRIIVQGMTGSEGRKHITCVLAYGAKTVASTDPKGAGTSIDFDITPYGPLADQLQGGTANILVYGTVAEVRAATGANTSVIFVPLVAAKGVILGAVDAGLDLVMVIIGYTPVQDASFVLVYTQERGVRVIGPNCPGVISPGKSNMGVTPGDTIPQEHPGSMSKSETLTYQMTYELRDLGLTTCIGINDGPIIDTTHIDAPVAFEQDPEAKLIVMIGEIGRDAEERVAAYIKEHVAKSMVTYVAGFTAPKGKTMGHAEAIVSGSSGTVTTRREALEAVGIEVGKTLSETTRTAREIISVH